MPNPHKCRAMSHMKNGDTHRCGMSVSLEVEASDVEAKWCYYHQDVIDGLTQPAPVTWDDEQVYMITESTRTGAIAWTEREENAEIAELVDIIKNAA